jgi:hypothetical protein
MSPNDTDTTTAAEQPPTTAPGVPGEKIGDATARIDMDEATFDELREAYADAVDHGYTEGFSIFAVNNLSIERIFTADGQPIDPELDAE